MQRLSILISCADFSRRTGMPIFIRTLSRELIAQGHQVAIVSPAIGLDDSIPSFLFKDIQSGAIPFEPDVLILNEPISETLLQYFPCTPAFNIIHSPRDCDAPIVGNMQVRRYLAVKDEDYLFCLSKGIPVEKIRRIRIPIDFKYFSKAKPEQVEFDIASISTIDAARKPMLLDLIDRARKGAKVLIAGFDFGALGDLSQYEDIKTLKIVSKEIDDVRPYIAQSKCVAGLLHGTITLEAWAMGKATMIYDWSGSVIKEYDSPPADCLKNDVKSVVKDFLDIVTEFEADIIIPHHNRADLLRRLLVSIPKVGFNVIVSKTGGSFSYNCNRGAVVALTDNLIFCNDDIVIRHIHSLWSLIDNPADIVGCETVYPDGRKQWIGIGMELREGKIAYCMAKSTDSAKFPSGGFFRIKKELFWRAGQPKYAGFSEEYFSGGEDQDLFLSALEKGAKISFCSIPVIHYLSSSEGRFACVQQNEETLRRNWLDDVARMEKAVGKIT